MKKFIIFALIALVSVSCYTDEDQKKLNENCRRLKSEQSALEKSVSSLNDRILDLKALNHYLELEKRELETGKENTYIVKFKIKQSTFTLDLLEHAKNEMNAIEVEIPVKKEYYNKLSIGQDLTDSFKYGSLIMDGDFSTLHMKVVGKRVE